MFFLKKIEGVKCPWCGKILKEHDECDEKIKFCCSIGVGLFVVVGGIFFAIPLLKPHIVRFREGSDILIPLMFVVLLTHNYYPVFKKGERNCASEPLLGKATVKWYTLRKGGIGLPRLRLVNNMIFSVCFVDKEGKPVSQTMLVRIRKKFGFLWTGAKVHLAVTDKFWTKDKNGKDPWKRAEKMVIFNNREIVGEAKLKKRC